MCGDLENYRPRCEYFPFNPDSIDRMFPDIDEFLEDESPGKARGLDTREDHKLMTTWNLGMSSGKACGLDAPEEVKLMTTWNLGVSKGKACGLDEP